MSHIETLAATVYRAPYEGAPRRISRHYAYSDWAKHIVRTIERERCNCDPGDDVTPGEVCGIHYGPSFVGHPEVWAGMVRRVREMLVAGWRP